MNLNLVMRMLGISEADVRNAVDTQVMPLIENVKRECKSVDERYTALFGDVLSRLVVIDAKLNAINHVLTLEGVGSAGVSSEPHPTDSNGACPPIVQTSFEWADEFCNGAKSHG